MESYFSQKKQSGLWLYSTYTFTKTTYTKENDKVIEKLEYKETGHVVNNKLFGRMTNSVIKGTTAAISGSLSGTGWLLSKSYSGLKSLMPS